MTSPQNIPAPMEQYATSLRIVHWLMALLVIVLLAVGLYMDGLAREHPNRATLYALHKSFGLLVFALLWLRIVLRVSTYIPPLPSHLPRWEIATSHLVHLTLYALLFLMPLSGYLMTAGNGFDVYFFGLKLPTLMAPNKPLANFGHDMHGLLWYGLVGLIALHVAGSLKHQYIDRYPIIKRMWR